MGCSAQTWIFYGYKRKFNIRDLYKEEEDINEPKDGFALIYTSACDVYLAINDSVQHFDGYFGVEQLELTCIRFDFLLLEYRRRLVNLLTAHQYEITDEDNIGWFVACDYT